MRKRKVTIRNNFSRWDNTPQGWVFLVLRLGYCFRKEPKNTSERSTVSSVTFLCALRITCYCFARPGCTSRSDCGRLAHTNPACYLALSQLGRAEFTDTYKPLASLLTFAYREENSDCLEKKLHPKVRCTVQDEEKGALICYGIFCFKPTSRWGWDFTQLSNICIRAL